MTTEPEVPLSTEEIAEPYGAAILAKFALCVARKCGHDITHHVGIPRRYLATIAAKDAALADVLSMSTCTKCGLRGVPTTYPVGGGPEPLKLVYRCSNEDCGYCVPPPMSAKIESLESQLRDANRRASELFAELGATQNAALAERVELESKLREAEGRIAVLLQSDQAWPLPDVLARLADFAHLQLTHNSFDGHGHESLAICVARARRLLAALQSAQKEK